MAERITDAELHAYVDGQLDLHGRVEVADYLVQHPEIAARVLADLRAADAMRMMAERHEVSPPSALLMAARRLDGGLKRRRLAARARRLGSASALLLALGIGVAVQGGHLGFSEPAHAATPVFIEEALMSHQTALVRQHMRSQLEMPHFDADDVRTATRIRVPTLPKGWRILDVQLFPSDYGPSLQIVIDAGQGAPVSLFAARTQASVQPHPTVDRIGGEDLAYWARDGIVYVLTGDASSAFLRQAADDLSDNQDA